MDPTKDKKDNKEEEQEKQKYRVCITHRNVKEIESACNRIVNQASQKNDNAEDTVAIRGPIRMPTKVLNITTRKAPCGNGEFSASFLSFFHTF